MTIVLSKYWKERYELEEQRRAKSDDAIERQLDAIYKQHIKEIQKEIDAFWQRYADKNGITKLEAKKQADKLDMDVVSYKAKQLVARAERMRQNGHKVTQKDFTKAENDLMKLYNLKMKTSRLEVLQANLKLHQYELAMNELEATERHLIEALRQENLYSSGILRDTLGSYRTAKTSAETIAYANFHGSNWSTKIWERQYILREVVRKSVADTILRGKGTQLLIKQLEKEFKVSYGYARRLAVTETARVYSEAQKANYKANDFEYYEILAESGACNICKPYDEKHYKVDDMVPGHNAPPFHPNCRCTTVPYLERERPEHNQKYLPITPEDVQLFKETMGKATDKEKEIIYANPPFDYRGYIRTPMSFDINRGLREGKLSSMGSEVENIVYTLDNVISVNEFPRDVVLTRFDDQPYLGAIISQNTRLKDRMGNTTILETLNSGESTFYNQGFTSMSYFEDKTYFEDRLVVTKINVPKGSKAYFTDNDDESEIILPRGSMFDIIRVENKEGKVYIEMTLKEQDDDVPMW